MENKLFFSTYQSIYSIWKLIKEYINLLEINKANLSDYFVYLIKLAYEIYWLLSTNTFKSFTIKIFNY